MLKHGNYKHVKETSLLASEYNEAELQWVQECQCDAFSSDISRLQLGKQLTVKSHLLPLSPFYDGRHLRVGGRLAKSVVPLIRGQTSVITS